MAVVGGTALALAAVAAVDPASLLERRLRPKPPIISRGRIDKDFAVLLMRTSYAKCEEMHFVAMDEFQRQFFLLRQDEWRPYTQSLEGLVPRQGDLSDPAYFDFISFAQYRTLDRAMQTGKLSFMELVGADGAEVFMERPEDVPRNNALLPREHSMRVGDSLVSWMGDRYDIRPEKSWEGIQRSVKEVLEVFRINNFAADATVSGNQDRETASLACTLVAPATLWSQRVLERSLLHNDYEAKAVAAQLRACGVPPGDIRQVTRLSDIGVTHSFRFPL